jgi:MoaA/NifB/PqqE/SkfB family radical SAM enzyme
MADPKVVEKVLALTPSEIEISVHGARPETHDALTHIRGSFEKTWQAIDNLVAAGLKVTLKCPITRINQNELFEIRDLGRRRGLRVQFDAVITPKDDGSKDPLALRADDEMIERYWGEWYTELHDGSLPPRANHCASEGGANCGTARSGFTIDPYGNILPCVAFRRPAGNILKIERMADVWHAPVFTEIRDLAVEARTRLDQHENGKYFTFCLGVAETQQGDPLAMYPQAEINARAVRRHYELLQIQDPEPRAKSA